MPAVIRHIDAIAREKQRDVLYLAFHPVGPDGRRISQDYDWQADPVRARIIDWLDSTKLSWEPCGPYASVNVLAPYRGQIYLDVPYDESLDDYCKLRDFLEYPDGSIRHPGVRFYGLTLEQAMENAEHDTPGFWERWAENF